MHAPDVWVPCASGSAERAVPSMLRIMPPALHRHWRLCCPCQPCALPCCRSSSKADLARLALEGREDEGDFCFADKISALMHASHFPLGEVTIEYRDLRVVRGGRWGWVRDQTVIYGVA